MKLLMPFSSVRRSAVKPNMRLSADMNAPAVPEGFSSFSESIIDRLLKKSPFAWERFSLAYLEENEKQCQTVQSITNNTFLLKYIFRINEGALSIKNERYPAAAAIKGYFDSLAAIPEGRTVLYKYIAANATDIINTRASRAVKSEAARRALSAEADETSAKRKTPADGSKARPKKGAAAKKTKDLAPEARELKRGAQSRFSAMGMFTELLERNSMRLVHTAETLSTPVQKQLIGEMLAPARSVNIGISAMQHGTFGETLAPARSVNIGISAMQHGTFGETLAPARSVLAGSAEDMRFERAQTVFFEGDVTELASESLFPRMYAAERTTASIGGTPLEMIRLTREATGSFVRISESARLIKEMVARDVKKAAEPERYICKPAGIISFVPPAYENKYGGRASIGRLDWTEFGFERQGEPAARAQSKVKASFDRETRTFVYVSEQERERIKLQKSVQAATGRVSGASGTETLIYIENGADGVNGSDGKEGRSVQDARRAEGSDTDRSGHTVKAEYHASIKERAKSEEAKSEEAKSELTKSEHAKSEQAIREGQNAEALDPLEGGAALGRTIARDAISAVWQELSTVEDGSAATDAKAAEERFDARSAEATAEGSEAETAETVVTVSQTRIRAEQEELAFAEETAAERPQTDALSRENREGPVRETETKTNAGDRERIARAPQSEERRGAAPRPQTAQGDAFEEVYYRREEEEEQQDSGSALQPERDGRENGHTAQIKPYESVAQHSSSELSYAGVESEYSQEVKRAETERTARTEYPSYDVGEEQTALGTLRTAQRDLDTPLEYAESSEPSEYEQTGEQEQRAQKEREAQRFFAAYEELYGSAAEPQSTGEVRPAARGFSSGADMTYKVNEDASPVQKTESRKVTASVTREGEIVIDPEKLLDKKTVDRLSKEIMERIEDRIDRERRRFGI